MKLREKILKLLVIKHTMDDLEWRGDSDGESD